MNGNFKYTLTDEQRNQLHQYLTGKDTKGMASRKDVCQFLQDALDEALNAALAPQPEPLAEGRYMDVSFRIEDEISEPVDAPDEFCSDDCCRANDLLRTRMNRLQHLLDTRG